LKENTVKGKRLLEATAWILYNNSVEVQIMAVKSLLIKDTTREERIKIVQQGLNQCGGSCDFCNGCDNLGGGSVESFFEPYINGEKELRQLNEEYAEKVRLVR
jgi:hypothetical protein